MVLYITSEVTTKGTVEVFGGILNREFFVNANSITKVQIPYTAHMLGPGKFNKAIHITSEKPVSIYAHIYYTAVSGATLLIPQSALGKNYFSINYTQKANAPNDDQPSKAYSAFNVIATDDNTQVQITPSADLLDNHPANQAFVISLNKGEVFQGLSDTDLTGTTIETVSTSDDDCKRIAVFSGATKLGIGCKEGYQLSSDNVFQQVYPTSTWGKNYLTVPLKNRNYDIFRVILSDQNTDVTLNGISITPRPGERYIEFKSKQTNVISADKPIQVVQYAVTQGQSENCVDVRNDLGDPEMIFLNPIEQTIEQVTVYSPIEYAIRRNYINVIIPESGLSSFRLDGQPYSGFQPMTNKLGYSYAQIEVTDGVHNLTSSTGFNAIAYGFGDKESYGYSAGTNLASLEEKIYLGATDGSIQRAGCSNVDYHLRLQIPYRTNRIIWEFNDGRPTFVDNNPVYTKSTNTDGKVIYEYTYPQIINYSEGDYSIKASVANIDAPGDCANKLDIYFDFSIRDLPSPAFTYNSACLNEDITFTDKSDLKNSFARSWLWDFGDGETSTEQNPKHTYTRPGVFYVKLTVENGNGCSETTEKPITINALPEVTYNYDQPACTGKELLIRPLSAQIAEIDTWEVNYGDGSGTQIVNATTNALRHTFTSTGTFNITVRGITKSGCHTKLEPLSILVNQSAEVAFTVPQICVNDIARFSNESTIADGSALTYRWNFGEPSSGTRNTSAERTPTHQYSKPDTYDVTLIVTTASGCVNTITHRITVNSPDISGEIGVVNEDNLCSASEVEFLNNTVVGYGKFIKLEIYFDVAGNPPEKVTYTAEEVAANGIKHKYPTFNSSAPKQYLIRMLVYSGESCFTPFEKTITLYPEPDVTLTPSDIIVSVCVDGNPINFSQNSHGISGKGMFAGTGITEDGVFNPQVAGPGDHQINYTFVSDKGCDFTRAFTVHVDAIPQVQAQAEYTVFKNKGFTIPVQATGNNLTYKWAPSTGLSRDDVLQPVITIATDAQYTLTVTSGECSYTVIPDIRFVVKDSFFIPNTFTPNGDGINDTWKINLIEFFPNCLMSIYNRNGTKVFESRGYTIPWDGTVNGTLLPAGTYYYAFNPGDGRKVNTGYVTILK